VTVGLSPLHSGMSSLEKEQVRLVGTVGAAADRALIPGACSDLAQP
jgi:hypothetical protein